MQQQQLILVHHTVNQFGIHRGRPFIAKLFAHTAMAIAGHITDDNNIAESALRMVNLGRKNFLFFGSAYREERGALLYSLIGTSKLNGVEPESYFRHILRPRMIAFSLSLQIDISCASTLSR